MVKMIEEKKELKDVRRAFEKLCNDSVWAWGTACTE